MKKNTQKIVKGILLILIGVVIWVLNGSKIFPFDITSSTGMALLSVWAIFGWPTAMIFIFWGLCKIFLDDGKSKKSGIK